MKKITKIKIAIALAAFVLSSNVAFAQALFTAEFSSEPLFTVSNFAPGNSSEAWIEMTNTSGTEQQAYIEAVNVFDEDNLGSRMQIQITEGEGESLVEIYDENFAKFLEAGPVSLSDISSEGSARYDLRVTFLENREGDNDFQNKNLGFDICVAFLGGDLHCTDTTVVGEEQTTPPGGGGGGGGGSGSSSGRHNLLIYNENAAPTVSQTTVTWNTNIPATTQVIYGPAFGALYPFDVNVLPAMGYPSVTVENMSKTTTHTINLTGLTPGETYVYRVVSRASPPSVSFEGRFTVPGTLPANPTPTTLAQNTNTQPNLTGNVSQSGTTTATTTDELEDGEIAGAFDSNDVANVFSGGLLGDWTKWGFWGIILAIIAYFIWWKTKKSSGL